MKTNSVGWFEIYVNDMALARKFYEAVLDKKLKRMETPESAGVMEMYGFQGDMESYGANGALVKMPEFPVGRNSVLIYFSCNDCSVEEKRVVKNGGKIEKTKFSIGEFGFISIVYDSEGNMFGLHSMQ